MPEHHRAFGSLFFLLHQGKLLWLLNAPVVGRWFRWCMRIRRWDIGPHERICAFAPDHFTVRLGVDRLGRTKYRTDFRTHAKFSKRLYYAFRPLWWAMHAWDWCVADRWIPQLSFGFDTLTKYPDAHTETATVDGYVEHAGTDITWAALRDGAGTAAADNVTPINGCIWLQAGTTSSRWSGMDRGVFLYDTTALTSGAVISGVVLSLYGSGTDFNTGGWSSTFNVYSSAPASNTALAAGDYDSLGTTAFSDSAIAYASWSASGYNDWAFNTDGIAAISKIGVSKFGTRCNHDVTNTAPTWGSDYTLTVNCYGAEDTGTTRDPKLVVTYTIEETVPYVIAYVTRTDLFAGTAR
jgi:hypothetical protein